MEIGAPPRDDANDKYGEFLIVFRQAVKQLRYAFFLATQSQEARVVLRRHYPALREVDFNRMFDMDLSDDEFSKQAVLPILNKIENN